MISLQTNVNALVALENLRITSVLQDKTIQELTSGYRINSSGDDAAGLSVANRYRNDVAELAQGVRNANDGISQLQIADSGLSDIAQLLGRLKTLATQSATGTFIGDRTVLNNEYQLLLAEITRQASSIGLGAGGDLNQVLSVYVGGGAGSQERSIVDVDLSSAANSVDAVSLGLSESTAFAGT